MDGGVTVTLTVFLSDSRFYVHFTHKFIKETCLLHDCMCVVVHCAGIIATLHAIHQHKVRAILSGEVISTPLYILPHLSSHTPYWHTHSCLSFQATPPTVTLLLTLSSFKPHPLLSHTLLTLPSSHTPYCHTPLDPLFIQATPLTVTHPPDSPFKPHPLTVTPLPTHHMLGSCCSTLPPLHISAHLPRPSIGTPHGRRTLPPLLVSCRSNRVCR